jgi:hypothetical protein
VAEVNDIDGGGVGGGRGVFGGGLGDLSSIAEEDATD